MGLLLDVIYLLVAAVTAPWWMRKARGGWAERFGRTEALPAPAKPRVLIHAVSVGEVNVIRGLVEALRGEMEVVVSATTDTGTARAQALFGALAPEVRVVRYPIDASWAVRRFLDAVRPGSVALVELEVWPNFVRRCAKRGIPVGVVNGRLSARSFKRYALIAPFLRGLFGTLRFVAAQNGRYAERFRALGVDPSRVRVEGSMKWDAVNLDAPIDQATELARALGLNVNRPTIVAGSTAPEEHALLREACPAGAQLICAPRRPEWFEGAAQALAPCARRSAPDAARPEAVERAVLDTIGELRAAYALADVVVVGRSFGGLHGSDPMEPAGLGKPIVIGPAFEDFEEAVTALSDAGGLIRTTREDLARVLAELMRDADRRVRMGAAALQCVRENQGATTKQAASIRAMVADGGAC